MSYVGNTPISVAFLTDTFSGNGTTTAFTMAVAPANTSSIIVAITGVVQDPSTYSVSGTTLTFSAAPPTGTSNISVRYLGIPASGVTTTAYRTVTNFTATAGQTSFSTPSYTVGYIDVYRNGVRLVSTDFTATTGTTVVLNNGATAGDTITTESFFVSSVLNALPQTGGTLTGQLVVNGATGQNPLITQVNSSEVMRIDSSGNMGLGVVPSTWSVGKAVEVGFAGTSLYSTAATQTLVTANTYYNGAYKYASTSQASYYQQYLGVHSLWSAGSGTSGSNVTFSYVMTLGKDLTLALQGANTAASGTGISFPATQSASSDVNTLDDYEEGTFTPVVIGSTSAGTATYVAQVGKYVKVGQLVACSIHVNYSAGTGTGNLFVGGLPFTAGVSQLYPVASLYVDSIAYTANSFIQGYLTPSTTSVAIIQTNGGTATPVPYDAAGVILISITYYV